MILVYAEISRLRCSSRFSDWLASLRRLRAAFISLSRDIPTSRRPSALLSCIGRERRRRRAALARDGKKEDFFRDTGGLLPIIDYRARVEVAAH